MKKAYKYISLVLAIIFLFVGTTSNTIFAITERTIVRDIDEYNNSGFPVDFYAMATNSQLLACSEQEERSELLLNIAVKSNSTLTYCYLEYFGRSISNSDGEQNNIKNQEALTDTTLSKSAISHNIFIGELYNFSIKVYERSVTTTFMGTLCLDYVYYDVGQLLMDIQYTVYTNAERMTRNVSYVSEVEANNSFSDSQEIASLVPITGNISSSPDVDYYKIEFDSDFYTNCVNTQFVNGMIAVRLTVPDYVAVDEDEMVYETLDLDMRIYSENQSLVGSSTSPAGFDEYFTFYHSVDDVYYIRVESYSSIYPTPDYVLSVTLTPWYTWYSQISGMGRGSGSTLRYLWDTHNLDKFYFSNNTSKCFISDSHNNDLMIEGCAIASYAMVLSNYGASFSGKDIRTGYVGTMKADPYTVTLANVDSDGTDITESGGNFYLSTSSDPMLVGLNGKNNISNYFNVPITEVNVEFMSESEIISELEYRLMFNYHGVVVKFYNQTYGMHFIVFNQANPNYISGSSTNTKQKFLVSDPGTSYDSLGNNKSFASCYSGSKYSYTDAVAIYLIGDQEEY